MALLRALPLLALGCGLGASPGGGADNLPSGGTGPYSKLSDAKLETLLDEPFVVTELSADLAEPSALVLDSETYRIWFSRTPRTPPGAATEIWSADLPSALKAPPSAITPAIRPDQPYEAGRAAAPSVVRDAENDQLVMFYEAGTDLVARAVSSDEGATWTKEGMVLADARLPSAILVDGEWLLYATRPSGTGIFVARSSDGRNFTWEPAAVIAPSGYGVDGNRVDSPSAVAETTPVGQTRIWLFYAAAGADDDGALAGIAYAGSHDGITFFRGGRGEPVLVPASTDDRSGAALIGETQSIMFYGGSKAGVKAIGAARTP